MLAKRQSASYEAAKGSRMLRISAPAYRFLLVVVIASLLVSWSLDWLPQSTYLQPAVSSGSRERRSRQVYASEEHKNSTFTTNGSRYRWSTLHANVLQENDERYMEVLAFLEGRLFLLHMAEAAAYRSSFRNYYTCRYRLQRPDFDTSPSYRPFKYRRGHRQDHMYFR